MGSDSCLLSQAAVPSCRIISVISSRSSSMLRGRPCPSHSSCSTAFSLLTARPVRPSRLLSSASRQLAGIIKLAAWHTLSSLNERAAARRGSTLSGVIALSSVFGSRRTDDLVGWQRSSAYVSPSDFAGCLFCLPQRDDLSAVLGGLVCSGSSDESESLD